MRYAFIDTGLVEEVQLSISVSAVPVPVWCWVSRSRRLAEEDLRKTAQAIKLAFDDELALAGSARPGLWRVKELGATGAAGSVYVGTLCSLPRPARPRLLGPAPPSRAPSVHDRVNEFLFNEVHNFDVGAARAFPLSEHLQHSPGPHSYAVSLLFAAGALGGGLYGAANNLARSFLASVEGHLRGLRPGTVAAVRDLVSQEIHHLLCSLSQLAPPRSLPAARPSSPLQPPPLPGAFRDLQAEYGGSPAPGLADALAPPAPAGLGATLLSFASEQDLRSHLRALEQDVVAGHYLRLEPASQGIRPPGGQAACRYCVLRYTEEQHRAASRLLNVYRREGARFVNLVLSNLCCADFRIAYLGPYPLARLLDDTVAALLPEHRRQLFRARAAHTPLDVAYCTCAGSPCTLLLEHRPAVSAFNVLYSAAPDPPGHTGRQAEDGQGGAEPSSEPVSRGRACQRCGRPLYVPRLHLDASSQVLSADPGSGCLALQQFCAATGRPLCVVNLLADDVEGGCFVASLSAVPHLQRLPAPRAEKILPSRRSPLLLASGRAPGLYCDDGSAFYGHLLRRLLAAPRAARRFVLGCRLLRLQYYFSSVAELGLLDYLRLAAQTPPDPSAPRRAQGRLADIRSLSELASAPPAGPLYLALPISRERIASVCGLLEHSLCSLNGAFTLRDSANREEPLIHVLLANGFRAVGLPDVCLPVSDAAKWAQICAGAFGASGLSCLVRLRSNGQVITSDLVPFGVATVTNHRVVADGDEFPHASLAMKCGILGA
ncbi:hypothetical protein GL50803_00112018 [Giardia duodenalis]|uniref:Uncharacterized protein n=1 Tax=Giardia intestinalis (strain ATCC 50803 / WB clone C6) TaxID=184922 RepID=A8BMB6_GIAIC|nr:hypothetical protein GL50803_00112018 [Giardia intestinalis]KAE8303985.1 hypothetical protein GL50803_00112018 [Giardia intestinalis]|eukprot:XP_001706064.1 Hypothetical protein GL50803_112018 [Giardia lamblia ATCC 50803]